jgi:hypothetical protein
MLLVIFYLLKMINGKKKKKTKGYDCISTVWLFMLIGCGLEQPPWRSIAEVSREAGLNWTTTRNILDLLTTLSLLNKEGVGLKKRYQYRALVDKQDYMEAERLFDSLEKEILKEHDIAVKVLDNSPKVHIYKDSK